MVPPLPSRDELPGELLERVQWVGWRKQTRGEDETKVPLNVNGGYASATDATTWTTFDEALAYVTDGAADGVGFVFTTDDPFVGVDLDKCRDGETGETEEWANVIIDRLNSYTEISPSRTGYHVIVEGELPPDGNRTGGLELYEHSRFFTVTGDRVNGTPLEVVDRTDELTAIHGEYFETTNVQTTSRTTSTTSRESSTPDDAPGNNLTDDDVIERASNAANGSKFSRLWKGDASAYDSHSEADMALCSMLAFWTGGDAAQMDRLVRDSGLYRGKWDDVHFADGSTYGEKTIDRAIAGTTEYYDPSQWSDAERREGPRSTVARGVKKEQQVRHDDTDAVSRGETMNTEDSPRDAGLLQRLENLQTQLESVIGENERLRAELEAERERRQELEAQLAAETGDTTGWSLFGWLK